jgi:hypothetical protein
MGIQAGVLAATTACRSASVNPGVIINPTPPTPPVEDSPIIVLEDKSSIKLSNGSIIKLR